jgi:hypothetical protein
MKANQDLKAFLFFVLLSLFIAYGYIWYIYFLGLHLDLINLSNLSHISPKRIIESHLQAVVQYGGSVIIASTFIHCAISLSISFKQSQCIIIVFIC